MQECALALIILLDPVNSGHRPFFSYLNIGCFHGFVPITLNCIPVVVHESKTISTRLCIHICSDTETALRLLNEINSWHHGYIFRVYSPNQTMRNLRPCYLLWGCPHAFSSNTKSDKEDGRWRTDGWCWGKEGAKEILIRTKERQGASSQMWISSSGPTNLRVTAFDNDNLWQ